MENPEEIIRKLEDNAFFYKQSIHKEEIPLVMIIGNATGEFDTEAHLEKARGLFARQGLTFEQISANEAIELMEKGYSMIFLSHDGNHPLVRGDFEDGDTIELEGRKGVVMEIPPYFNVN